MKVLLIQPTENEGQMFPSHARPLALELLAAHLDGHEVHILDLRVDPRALEHHLLELQPDVVGVTCTFACTVPVVQRTLRAIRRHVPCAVIAAGGVHASLQPGDFAYPLCDYLVRGAGERTFSELVDALERGNDPTAIRGLFVVRPGVSSYTGDRPGSDWDRSYRRPARALTDRYVQSYMAAPCGKPLVIMLTSRGCPHRCTFCAAWKLQEGRVTVRAAECIVDELAALEEEDIYFFDDNTLAPRRVMREVAELLETRGIRKRYMLWTSTDVICRDPALLRKWRKIGLERVFVGLETCREDRLILLEKRSRLAQNEEAYRLCMGLGIEVSPTFVIDHEFDGSDFSQLSDYVHEHGFRVPYFFILTPLPGTTLFERMAHQIVEGDPSRYDLHHLTIRPTRLRPEEFLARYVELYLQNETWQKAALVFPAVAKGLARLRAQPVYSLPVAGLDPKQRGFPALPVDRA